MKIDCKKLKELLSCFINGNISHSELTDLVHLSRAIIQSYLGYVKTSITQLCLHQGLTATDLAYDCIAEAFARNEQNKFPQIDNFIGSLHQKLEDIPETDLFLAFKQFLICIADAQLARLYAQADPAGAKIHRNLRDNIKTSNFLQLEKDFRGIVIKPKNVDTLNYRELFPIDEFERELSNRLDHQPSTPEFIHELYNILITQETYRRSMTLVEVTQIFKKVFQRDFEPIDVESFSVEGLTEFEIDRIRMQVELALKEKILLTYLAKGKVNRKEAEALFAAISDILEDWCSGEESQPSLFGYLNEHLPMNEEIYESTLRPKMEYLLKIAREEFAARLMKEI